MLLNCGVGEDSWESLELQGGLSWGKLVLSVHWKDWCWSWNSNILATLCEGLTHLKRPWCWERLRVGGEGDDGGWDGWMASPTQWTWVWVDSRSWWWTGRPGVLQSMGLQRVGPDWATELTDWWEPGVTCAVRFVAQSCPTLCDHMHCSPPGSSVHGILQARILQWVAMPSSRGSSQARDQTQVSRIADGFFTIWATREAQWILRSEKSSLLFSWYSIPMESFISG